MRGLLHNIDNEKEKTKGRLKRFFKLFRRPSTISCISPYFTHQVCNAQDAA